MQRALSVAVCARQWLVILVGEWPQHAARAGISTYVQTSYIGVMLS